MWKVQKSGKCQQLTCIQLFVTPWTVARRLLCPWDFPGKNTGVGCHFLLQGVFQMQGSNSHLLHQQADSLPLRNQGRSHKWAKDFNRYFSKEDNRSDQIRSDQLLSHVRLFAVMSFIPGQKIKIPHALWYGQKNKTNLVYRCSQKHYFLIYF